MCAPVVLRGFTTQRFVRRQSWTFPSMRLGLLRIRAKGALLVSYVRTERMAGRRENTTLGHTYSHETRTTTDHCVDLRFCFLFDEQHMERRRVLQAIAFGPVGLAAGVTVAPWLAGSEAERVLFLGAATSFAEGTLREFPEIGVAVRRDSAGFAFLSTHCTHLGCTLRTVGRTFLCPCHRGRYDWDGRVLEGPPPSDLPWYEGGITASGLLYVVPSKRNKDRRLVSL